MLMCNCGACLKARISFRSIYLVRVFAWDIALVHRHSGFANSWKGGVGWGAVLADPVHFDRIRIRPLKKNLIRIPDPDPT
jgi:hypothetical protein